MYVQRDLAMGQLNKIDHVVVLMLENRSFDSSWGIYIRNQTALRVWMEARRI
jgi:phospholipase C